ncbi:MAG: DUF2183 domain-containing protein [Campylobacteraceae bacterium]|jgi:hypothetical protein|nr:DUF2183 domain-containing protein [Campylobacteraceae bacterium]
MRKILKMKLLSFALCAASMLDASQLKSDEFVLFIPSIAYDLDDQTIAAEVKAFVYEKERRLGVTSAFAALLGIDMDALSQIEKERLYERSALFRVDYESSKEFFIKFENAVIQKMPQTKDGKSAKTFKLQKPLNHKINFELHKPINAAKSFALYAKNQGVSAVFDIDDTIKNSNVLDKKALLANTFLNEYETVEGIQKIFELVQNLRADAYHYVSGSPAQLYPELQKFFHKNNIPEGTFHLRDTTDLNDFMPSREATIKHKKENIEKLFKSYPKRKFILVGDSGESDPEIYADLQRKYPDKVLLIIIHDLQNSNGTSTKLKENFKGVDKSVLLFF